MHTDTIHEMMDFILLAKKASYVGGGNTLLPYRLGSHDLQFFKGDWSYHDSYLGESDFIGEEIVYHRGKVVWGMNYYGRMLRPEIFTSSQAGKVIQESLSAMYSTGRFLGGYQHTVGEFIYTDTNSGDVVYFTGKEWITLHDEVVYQLVYHGGLVQD